MSKRDELSDVPKQQFNIYLPPKLIRDLKHHCIDRGGSLSNLVEQIFRQYLAQETRAAKQKQTRR